MRSRALLIWCLVPALAAAQETQRRVPVNVDYIAGTSLYLSAGQGQGLFAADTVTAFRDAVTAPLGRLVIVSSTRARAIAAFTADSFTINRGDVLLLEIPEAALARLQQTHAQRDSQRADTPAPRAETVAPQRVARHSSPHVNGRIGLDFDARQTNTHWGPAPEQRTEHTYTNPALRLHVTATDLPGGMRFTTNLRATYYGSTATGESALSLQLYQAALHTDLGGGPIRLEAGRFYNPYESHSGYWDGVLLRVGGPTLGAGIVGGYEPALATQAFSTASPKTTIFLDVHRRQGHVRYDGDLSFHRHARSFWPDRREFAGLSQRLSIGRTYITQRMQIGKDAAGKLDLWQLQFSASLAVTGPLRINGRYSRERSDLYSGIGSGSGSGSGDGGSAGQELRERGAVGATLTGRAGYASIEGGEVRSAGATGRTVSFSGGLPRVLAGFGVGGYGSHWREGAFTASSAAASLDRQVGRVRARATGRFYRTDYGSRLFEQRGGELSFSTPLGAQSELALSAGTMRGASGSSNRVLLTVWKSF